MSLPRRMAVRAPVLVIAAALLLSGCSQLPEGPTASPDTTPQVTAPAAITPGAAPVELQDLRYETVAMTPVIDGDARPTGEVAQPGASKVTVFDAVDGNPLALLSPAESVPVIAHSPGWVRVMLPSRRLLPTQARPKGGVTAPDRVLKQFVNRGTGWIKTSEVTIKTGLPRVFVSKDNNRLEVISAAGRPLAVYHANIGAGVPEGPTFISSGIGVAAGCGDAAPIKLSAQSETEDGYRGQPVSPVFIAGPSAECSYTAQDVADMKPRMIQLSPADATQLASFLQPGIEVDVVAYVQPEVS